MRKLREVLRLKFDANLSIRQISACTKSSVGTIQKVIAQARQLGLEWPLPDELDDQRLAGLFYPGADTRSDPAIQILDWSAIHQELKRKGVTRQLLWEEYAAAYPNRCYSYSQFCARYQDWRGKQKRSMRQLHKAGEKCFVDYAGQTVPVIHAQTGEVFEAQIFVAVLGASGYTYAEATRSQSLPDWLQSHVRAFEYFGGTPELVVPDNLKSGVKSPCRYDPDINASYQQLAEHYQLAVVPARPYKPKDKAKAEVGVQIVERWILARLRKLSFFSLPELNQCIGTLLETLNHKPFRAQPGHRRQAFEQLDQPALRPLPRQPCRYTAIKTVKVNIDYHVQYQQHHYSVPHHYVGERLELHASDHTITLYFRDKAVASHMRKAHPGMTTEPGHMPQRHRKHQQWNPGRLKNWASTIGADMRVWVDDRLREKAHPEQAYRICLGLLNLSRDYPASRLNNACALANREGLNRLKHIKSILQSNRDQLPEQLTLSTPLPQQHENIRGPHTFH